MPLTTRNMKRLYIGFSLIDDVIQLLRHSLGIILENYSKIRSKPRYRNEENLNIRHQ